MSEKKYPKDTPVTLEMLAEIMKKAHYPTINKIIKSMIEPPGPEPKDGEWWMCRFKNKTFEHNVVLERYDGWWRVTNESQSKYGHDENITPLYKMERAEG